MLVVSNLGSRFLAAPQSIVTLPGSHTRQFPTPPERNLVNEIILYRYFPYLNIPQSQPQSAPNRNLPSHPKILENAFPWQSQCPQQITPSCESSQSPKTQCSEQDLQEPSRNSQEQRSASYQWSCGTFIQQKGEEGREGEESCEAEGGGEGYGDGGRGCYDW